MQFDLFIPMIIVITFLISLLSNAYKKVTELKLLVDNKEKQLTELNNKFIFLLDDYMGVCNYKEQLSRYVYFVEEMQKFETSR